MNGGPHILLSRTCECDLLFGKRVFADTINGRILRGDHTTHIRVGSKATDTYLSNRYTERRDTEEKVMWFGVTD